MERVPEPELMDEVEQARAYAEADFAAPHDRFVSLFGESFRGLTLDQARVIDLGCGPADVTIRFSRAYPKCSITGLDAGPNMLILAEQAVRRAGLSSRIELVQGRLPGFMPRRNAYDAVISNSLLHHLGDPMTLWQTIRHCAKPGAPVFIMDLLRPANLETLDNLVNEYTRDEPEVLRQDFRNSLKAGYRSGEVEMQAEAAGLPEVSVRVVSDRHWIASGRTPVLG